MGRKPVLGLVGACLASVAFVGCDNSNLLQQGGKKDVTTATNNNNTGWKTTPQGGQTGTPAAGNSGATGNTVANTSGSFNVNPRGPVGDYPEGRSMPIQPANNGGVEHVGYSTTAGADVRTTSSNPAADPSTGGLPALTKPLPTGGVSGATTVTSSPGMSTLPPLTPAGPAHPRVDTFPPPATGTRPVVVPPTSGAPTSGAPDASSSVPLPPTPADTGSSTELPPVPPLPPVSQGTKAFQTPPLPSAPASSSSINPPPPLPSVPTPSGMGVPAAPTKNQASFQQ